LSSNSETVTITDSPTVMWDKAASAQ
jgi:hypothetical protein